MARHAVSRDACADYSYVDCIELRLLNSCLEVSRYENEPYPDWAVGDPLSRSTYPAAVARYVRGQ